VGASEFQNGQLGFLFEEPKVPARRIWTVRDLVGEVRSHIEREYADLWVEGEISNFRAAPSGHLYFTLKDGESQLPVVLFRKQSLLLRFRPADGLQVLVRGKVSVYEQRGQMQLVAEWMEPVGAGSLQIAFEQLKTKLREEGLFATERKRPLPAFPRCVGIVTSPSGAVIRDFLHVVARRHAALDVLLYPAVVQGETAAAEIAAGIRYFNQAKNVDVIVIARGGGSLEDLAPFNSEGLARVIAASQLPVVSAVGHETDYTIADFVADLRAPTPSAAAELITAVVHNVEERVAQLFHRLERGLRYRLIQARHVFSRFSIDAALERVHGSLGRRQQRIDELGYRIEACWRRAHRTATTHLHELTTRLHRQDVSRQLELAHLRLAAFITKLDRSVDASLRAQAARNDQLYQRLVRAQQSYFSMRQAECRTAEDRLNLLSPLAVLNRGYALVFSLDGQLIKNAHNVEEGDILTTRLANGTVTSRVTGRINKDNSQL
jgi:exodeoxyribonuclease VII large subunit